VEKVRADFVIALSRARQVTPDKHSAVFDYLIFKPVQFGHCCSNHLALRRKRRKWIYQSASDLVFADVSPVVAPAQESEDNYESYKLLLQVVDDKIW